MPLSRPSAFAQRQVVNRKYTASIKTRGCSIFVRNFNKFKHITVISGKQHHENAAKLLLQRTATLTNQCSTLPCKILEILLLQNVKTDKVQQQQKVFYDSVEVSTLVFKMSTTTRGG